VWNGEVRFNEGWLDQPIRWQRPRRIFVCAHGDLFHPAVPDVWIDQVFAVMALCPHHTFQLLTKRPERMRAYLRQTAMPHRVARVVLDLVIAGTVKVKEPWPVRSLGDDVDAPDDVTLHHWPLPNVWLGVSVEDQVRANERVPVLLDTPAAVRWISAEPLLGPVDLDDIVVPMKVGEEHFSALYADVHPEDDQYRGATINWVVAGGESGKDARPMHPAWARSLRDQCQVAGVAFMFKQWGAWAPREAINSPQTSVTTAVFYQSGRWFSYDVTPAEANELRRDGALEVYRVDKKAASRRLDGELWDQYPA
jgi:protein gp37